MENLAGIKLIIWDLDETLWRGTISEEEVILKSGYEDFLKNTLDMGIVHSICSKNEFEIANRELEKLGIWDLFVFPSINWEAKGGRIKQMIADMGLRAVNVLFVDDNPQNLNEAKYFCPEINIALPNELEKAFAFAKAAEKKDLNHQRLKQYKLLQQKHEEKSAYDSNEEFLLSCNIRVEILYDCVDKSERLHELLIRSNQLNFTKIRPSKEEFDRLLNDESVRCGYVRVKDRFGDYGIVGFFALKNNNLIHYTFSCRTLGMRVEQYVYMQLCCPELVVVGDVVAALNNTEMPRWINQDTGDKVGEESSNIEQGLLLKGPCDMQQIFAFIRESDSVVGEFSYANAQGVLTEGHNHTAQIVSSWEATEAEKETIFRECPWLDKDCFSTGILDEKYDFVVISMLTDGNLGVYRNKKNNICISLCESYYDLTDPNNREKYINKEIFTSGINFTEEILCSFAENYEYVDNSSAEVTIENLNKIRSKLNAKTKLVLLLGSEREFKGNGEPSYKGRHLVHKLMNEKISYWASTVDGVILIKIDDFLRSQNDFLDTINHFVKRVYFELALKIMEIVDSSNNRCKQVKKSTLMYQTMLQRLRILKRKIAKAF